MTSNVHFNRWRHVQNHSWPFIVFKKHNQELSYYIWADYSATRYVYKQLGKNGVNLTDSPNAIFSFPAHVWNFQTVKDWSISFNNRQNQFYLDCVMALSGNLETFIASIIALAIESNPGVLLGAPKTIDGTFMLKYSPIDKDVYEKVIEGCVKGTWAERKKNIRQLFGSYPTILDTEESTLEKIRKLRNKVGHAFGRDIEESRNFKTLNSPSAERISLERLRKYLKCAFEVACEMDAFLLNNSIGEYQAVLAYHNNKNKWDNLPPKSKVKAFKKYYGAYNQLIGKVFSDELIQYYDNI